jgi:hypothetical protein
MHGEPIEHFAPHPPWVAPELFPFRGRFVDAGGHRLHYIDEGAGPTKDVTFNAEGATRYGRVRAVRRPLRGANAVARLLLAVQQQAPSTLQYRIAEVNGGPAVLAYEAGQVLSVLSLDAVDGRVHGIYVLADPVKLQSLGALRTWH